MNSADSFSENYQTARSKFRAAVQDAGGELEIIIHPERGSDGGDLSTDVAWFGPRDAGRVLVLISGTHGVEGFCGSGAQIDWLRRGEAARLPDGMAALVIHAINPYGFDRLRRVTHENIDLNRNWIDFVAPLPTNIGYDELSDVICPGRRNAATQRATGEVLSEYATRKGAEVCQYALSGGQYRYPSGIFYGGQEPSWSRQTQTAILANYLDRARKIAILDFHSGLGPVGFAEQIVTSSRGSAPFKRAQRWFGAALTSASDSSSASASIVGDGLSAAHQLLAHAEVTAMALEVGTVPTANVIQALRADAWLHAYGDPLGPEAGQIKFDLKAAFYVDTDVWKGMVAGQSLIACRQAVAGLEQ